jgi:hypothetical protein
MEIQKEQWLMSQQSEFDDHVQTTNIGQSLSDFNNYFHFFGDKEDCINKKILEVGSGVFPLGRFLESCDLTVVEPLYDRFDEGIKEQWKQENIQVFSDPFEEMEIVEDYDEIWFINFLQHTINPTLCLNKAKESGAKIRVFEPINTAINLQHPHSLTVELFSNIYPEADIKVYHGGSMPGFHTASCCYFVS